MHSECNLQGLPLHPTMQQQTSTRICAQNIDSYWGGGRKKRKKKVKIRHMACTLLGTSGRIAQRGIHLKRHLKCTDDKCMTKCLVQIGQALVVFLFLLNVLSFFISTKLLFSIFISFFFFSNEMRIKMKNSDSWPLPNTGIPTRDIQSFPISTGLFCPSRS